MKKFVLGIFLISIMLLTGCTEESKVMTCKVTKSDVEIEITMNYLGKKLEDVKVNLSKNIKDYEKVVKEELKKQDFCAILGKETGFNEDLSNCTQEITDEMLLINGNIDVNKIEMKEKIKDMKPEEAKENLETDGYVCEIK